MESLVIKVQFYYTQGVTTVEEVKAGPSKPYIPPNLEFENLPAKVNLLKLTHRRLLISTLQ